jgi:hypothetical protein
VPNDHSTQFFIFLRFYIFARESTLLPVATAAENINKIKIWRRKAAWEADEKSAHTENEKKNQKKGRGGGGGGGGGGDGSPSPSFAL